MIGKKLTRQKQRQRDRGARTAEGFADVGAAGATTNSERATANRAAKAMAEKDRLDYLEEDIEASPAASEGDAKMLSGHDSSDPKSESPSLDFDPDAQRRRQESRASLGALFANTYDIL